MDNPAWWVAMLRTPLDPGSLPHFTNQSYIRRRCCRKKYWSGVGPACCSHYVSDDYNVRICNGFSEVEISLVQARKRANKAWNRIRVRLVSYGRENEPCNVCTAQKCLRCDGFCRYSLSSWCPQEKLCPLTMRMWQAATCSVYPQQGLHIWWEEAYP